MQMINVLKRLAELDATNPNVAKPVLKADETLAVISESSEMLNEGRGIQLPKLPEPTLAGLKLLAGTSKLNESTIAECGMMNSGMGMPSAAAPAMPASINMSAGSAGEIVSMFRGIMDLAKSDIPTQAAYPAMGAPMPSLTPPMGGMEEPAEPEMDLPMASDDTGGDELADMMKKLSTGEPVKIKTDMPVKVSTDDDVKATTDKEVKSSGDTMNQKEEGYANSPDQKTKGYEPNDFANMINKVRTADLAPTPYGSASNPMPDASSEDDEEKMGESLASKLMDEYRNFMAEGEQTMSRAAKGHEKYGKEGMAALAKAGKEGKSLEPVRKKYDKYDESAKPDFLDLDKDGNKKEPMKKAAKDVKKK